jgi:hypothetical protein
LRKKLLGTDWLIDRSIDWVCAAAGEIELKDEIKAPEITDPAAATSLLTSLRSIDRCFFAP